MSGFKEVDLLPGSGSTVTVTPDVTIFNWTATDTTMTPTRVDTATAGTATGTVTFSATDATAAANLQVAIRALGGIYADATVVAGATADNMVITVFGGYDITWAKTGGTGTITETGAAGSDTATPGSVKYSKIASPAKFITAKKLVLRGWVDKSLDVSIVDKDSLNVFVATGIDTSAGNFAKLLTAAGLAGEDGAATTSTPSGGLFRPGLTMSVTTSSPVTARPTLSPALVLVVCKQSNQPRRFVERTTGQRVANAGAPQGTINLAGDIGIVRKIKLLASADTTVAPTVTDADGLVVYTKTSSDYTTAVVGQLTHEGVNQANGAVADILDVMAKFPLTVTGSGLGSGTFGVTVWVEA